ncbi:MAG TPA: hypothetical protein VJZ49_00680 [Syntrophales bacterium]|nr:hypothetical protein [Syntrophales bacterium]
MDISQIRDCNNVKLADLVNCNSLDAMFNEIITVAVMISPDFDIDQFRSAYDDIVSIYKGNYIGYKACNTEFHDLQHVIEVTLATARIAHSAQEAGYHFDHFDLLILLLSALMHDTGYIQSSSDDHGTGGKLTLVHVDRSIDFVMDYLRLAGYDETAISASSVIIKATDLAADIDKIPFPQESCKHLANIMATGDLLAQIADRLYLEKLRSLYKEFEEGRVPGFESELDLLEKTPAFFEYALKRMDNDLNGFRRHVNLHFVKRWRIANDLYQEAYAANIKYLNFLLEHHKGNYHEMLRRGREANRLLPNIQHFE